MYSIKTTLIREKRFPVVTLQRGTKAPHHSAATLTDDHTLFLLHQQRDRVEERSVGKKKWRLFG